MSGAVVDGAVALDDRPMRARVGLVVLATDHTTEPDYARIVAPQGIGVYATRIPFANPVTGESLAAMAPDITAAAALILPGEALDAAVYSCTSASVAIGDAAVRAALGAGKPGARAITPISAAFAAFQALGALRVSLLTPYDDATTTAMAGCLEAGGVSLGAVTGLGLTDDRDMARLSRAPLVEAAARATAPGSEALFVACTAVRAAAWVEALEAAAGVPVVTANLATAWAALRLCGYAGPAAPGRLMTLPLNDTYPRTT